MRTLRILPFVLLAACKPSAAPPNPATMTPSFSQAPGPMAASTSAPEPSSLPTATSSQAPGPIPVSTSAPDRGASDVPTTAFRDGESAFAARLYGEVGKSPDANVTVSPTSARMALGMAWAGARGQTADEMAMVLGLSGPPDRVHADFAATLRDFTAPPPAPKSASQPSAPTLKIVNHLWGQQGYRFVPAFLDLLSTRYGAPLALVDFARDPEDGRAQINRWVSDATAGKIVDLLARGSVDRLTRLVLTNAVYLKTSWSKPFPRSRTRKGPFTTASGNAVRADLMEITEGALYAEIDGAQVLTLPYAGSKLAMTVILPKERNGLPALEQAMGPESIARWTAARGGRVVHVVLPRFRATSTLCLNRPLADLGMTSAFDPQAADFSGMVGTRDLYVKIVVQKTFVAVDEKGTEAAAATAVVAEAMSQHVDGPPPPIEFRADHPFLFCIHDSKSGAVLFVGRVGDPTN